MTTQDNNNNKQTMDKLRQQFTDLSESILTDVYREVAGNEEQAQTILQQFANKEPTEQDQQRMLRELDSFHHLGQVQILETLKENKWDVEKTIVSLWSVSEEKVKEERRRKSEEERMRRAAETRKHANAVIKELFDTVPEAKIQQILEENDGDVNLAVEKLIELNRKDEKERRQREDEEKLKQEKIRKRDALALRFNKSFEELEHILNQLNWDVNLAINQLLKEEQDTKFNRVMKLYHFRRPEEIRHALETNNYDEQTTLQFMDRKIERENEETERRAREEVERKQREKSFLEDLERKRQEDMMKLQAIKEENLKREAERKMLEERKLAEQLRAEAERVRLEKERKERERELERQKEDEMRTMANLDKARMNRSVLINDKITIEVAELEQQEDPHYVLVKGLKKKLRDVGPQFNILYPNEPPLDYGVEDYSYPSTNRDTHATESSQLQPELSVVSLEVTPTTPDYGETITVNYDTHTLPASSSNWIAIFREGAHSKEYETYEWAPTQKGSLTFKAPYQSGNYDFKFFVNKTYNSCGRSTPIQVGPSFKITPTLDKNQVKLQVEQLRGQPCPSAWVAMYEPDRDNRKYYTYCYVSSSEVTFKVPKVGVWEFRLFPQKSYFVAASCKVNFKGDDTITLEIDKPNNLILIKHSIVTVDPNYDNVWIGIYHITEKDYKQYRRYKRVTLDNGTLSMKCMQTPGTYEARMFARGSPDVLTISNTVTTNI